MLCISITLDVSKLDIVFKLEHCAKLTNLILVVFNPDMFKVTTL